METMIKPDTNMLICTTVYRRFVKPRDDVSFHHIIFLVRILNPEAYVLSNKMRILQCVYTNWTSLQCILFNILNLTIHCWLRNRGIIGWVIALSFAHCVHYKRYGLHDASSTYRPPSKQGISMNQDINMQIWYTLKKLWVD